MKTKRVRPTTNERQTRSVRYKLVGIVILAILVLVAIASAVGIMALEAGSVNPQLSAAFYGLVLVCALLAFGVLYILFTLPRVIAREAPRAVPASRVSSPEPPAQGPQIEYGSSSRDVEILEGIGSVFSRRLSRAGIMTLQDLRQSTEEEVAHAAQVPILVAQKWKRMSNLMLVREIDAQSAELLVHCGIESIEELASQSPPALARKARQVNQSNRVRIYPMEISLATVEGWVDAAARYTEPLETDANLGAEGRRKSGATA